MATETTIRDLTTGVAVSAADLLISRQGADTEDKSITPAQLATYMSNSLVSVAGVQVDQSGGTSDTHGVLVGAVNGSNTSYTVSQSEYISGSLTIYLNGQLQTQGTSEDWQETLAGSGTFAFSVAPPTGSEITVVYTQANAITTLAETGNIRKVTAEYTIVATDATVIASSGSFDINLPTAVGATGRILSIGKEAYSGTVTITPNGTEKLIDSGEYTSAILQSPLREILAFQAYGGNWERVG